MRTTSATPWPRAGWTEVLTVGEHRVHGLPLDAQTRCEHYRGPADVVAIRFRCCDVFFPCFACHDAVAGHPPLRWRLDERDAEAVLCGVCARTIAIDVYVAVDACPHCAAAFNPGCRLHRHLYFD